MTIIINRTISNSSVTDGDLLIDSQHICHTTEATPHLLPEGTYSIQLHKCIRSKRRIPLIQLFEAEHYCNGRPTQRKCAHCTAFTQKIEEQHIAHYKQLQQAIDSRLPERKLQALARSLESQMQQEVQRLIQQSPQAGCCPMILPGNGAYHRHDGSILVGQRLQSGIVLHSRPIFDRLYERIEKAISRGHQVLLVIYNP